MMMRTAILTFPALLVACMTAAPEADQNSNTNNGCVDGKCDGADVWKWEAGKTPWVKCTSASNRVTCSLEAGHASVRPTRVLLGKGESAFAYSTTLTPTAPSSSLPETFSSSDSISIAAASPMAGLGDVRKVLRAPASGSSVTYQMPYDVWRVDVTSVGPAPAAIILKYDVQIADAGFLIAQGGNKVTQYGALSATPGANNASATKSHFLPVTAGGKVAAYFSAGSINEAPHFYVERPGCYLIEGSPVAILTYDENCTRTRQLVPVAPPASCACDVSSACDANCACDAACTTPPPPAQMCLAGTQYECDDAGEHWTNGQCCVDGPVECVPGSQYECDDAGERWTGSMCCIVGTPVCVAGSQYECDDSGEHWSGQRCCVDAPTKQCLAGSQYECDDAGETWTGSVCCVAESAKCVAGSLYECDDAGEHWTGSQCCVDGPAQCVAGSIYECDDAGESWTGSTCCVASGLTCTASSSSSCTGTGALFTGSQCCRP
jgi:hypothetical protein